MTYLASTREIELAVAAVREAVRLSRLVQADLVSEALSKADCSPVTVADFAVQAVIAGLLAEAFPLDPLVAEEDAALLRLPAQAAVVSEACGFASRVLPGMTAEALCSLIDRGTAEPSRRFWTLDPIDGTKGFLRGGHYATALSLLVDGRVEVAVLGCPHLGPDAETDTGGPGAVVVSARGQGSWISPADSDDFRKIGVSTSCQAADTRVLRSVESGHTNEDQLDRVLQELGVRASPTAVDSQVKYAMLAAGRGDVVLRLLSPTAPNYHEYVWDQAAGALIVGEAGGRMTDLDGCALDFTAGRTLARNRGVLASNGVLHARALRAVHQAQPR